MVNSLGTFMMLMQSLIQQWLLLLCLKICLPMFSVVFYTILIGSTSKDMYLLHAIQLYIRACGSDLMIPGLKLLPQLLSYK